MNYFLYCEMSPHSRIRVQSFSFPQVLMDYEKALIFFLNCYSIILVNKSHVFSTAQKTDKHCVCTIDCLTQHIEIDEQHWSSTVTVSLWLPWEK